MLVMHNGHGTMIRNINAGVSVNKNEVIVIPNFMSGMEGTYGTKVTGYIETPSPDKDTKPWSSLVLEINYLNICQR